TLGRQRNGTHLAHLGIQANDRIRGQLVGPHDASAIYRDGIGTGLFLDSRGMDLPRASHAIVASHYLLEVIIFQWPYQECAPSRWVGTRRVALRHVSSSPPLSTVHAVE